MEAAIEADVWGDNVCCEVLLEAVENAGVVESRAGVGSEVWFDAEDKSDAVI